MAKYPRTEDILEPHLTDPGQTAGTMAEQQRTNTPDTREVYVYSLIFHRFLLSPDNVTTVSWPWTGGHGNNLETFS